MLVTFSILPPPVQHERAPAVPLARVLDQAGALGIHISRTDFCLINLDYKSQNNRSIVLSQETYVIPFENCENFSLQYSGVVTWISACSSVLEVGPLNSLAPQPVT